MPGTKSVGECGHILALVLIFVALLATVAVLLLTSAQYAASGTRAMEQKNTTWDAAEAGLNAALDALDISLLAPTSRNAALPNGYRYSYRIFPNFTGSAPMTITDPVTGTGQVNVPAGGAVIVSIGTGPQGERPTTVEAAVSLDVTQITYPVDAILSGLNMQGYYNPPAGIVDSSGQNSAVLHANSNINALVAGGVQGKAEASGNKNKLPPGTTHAAQVPLPTVSQFDYMVASYRNQALLFPGPTNIYQPPGSSLSPNYSCTLTGSVTGCLLFYDGPLSLTYGQVTLAGPWTMVVNGNYKQMGPTSLTFTYRPNLLVVNGNAYLKASGATTAYLVVKGSTLLGGNDVFTGAIMTLGTLSFGGSGTAGKFVYDSSVIPPSRSITGLVKIVTYAEY